MANIIDVMKKYNDMFDGGLPMRLLMNADGNGFDAVKYIQNAIDSKKPIDLDDLYVRLGIPDDADI